MPASATLLLFVYCLAIACFSLVGGLLPNWVRMTHTRTQLVMSAVAGLMLGVAFYHLLPHSMALLPGPHAADTAVWWLMIGLIAMLLLRRMFHFHQHDFSHEEDRHHDHHHHHDQPAAHSLSWLGVALGLALHTLIDGVALGAVMLGDMRHGETYYAGPCRKMFRESFHIPPDCIHSKEQGKTPQECSLVKVALNAPTDVFIM